MFNRKAYTLLTLFICFILSEVYAQDQKIADSLVHTLGEKTLSDTAKLNLLSRLSFNEMRDLKKGLQYAEELISLSEQTGNKKYLGIGYFLEGTKKRSLGNLAEALEAYIKSAVIARETHQSAAEGKRYIAIAGENLAINFTDSKDVTAAWMKSPTHKANIIKENYTEIGTGIASGMYEGKEAIYVAQVYANPLIIRPESKNLATVTPTIIKEPKKDLAIKEATGTHSSNTKATPDNIVAQTEEPTNVLGAETKKIDPKIIISEDTNIKPLPKPTIIQKLAASPRHTANTILYIIFGIMAISLTLNIFIKIKHHHTDLITNGLITLAIIGAVLLGNYYLSKSTTVVVQSLDYSNESK